MLATNLGRKEPEENISIVSLIDSEETSVTGQTSYLLRHLTHLMGYERKKNNIKLSPP